MHEYIAMQVIATLLLIAFSILLGIRNRHLGFGTLGLAEMLEHFDARRQTPLGRRIRKPKIVRHARDAFRQALWGIAPSVVTLIMLASLAFAGRDAFILVPAIAVPYGIALFLFFWWIQRERIASYRDEYDEYLRLTDPANLWFEGRMSEPEEPELLRGGRVIEAHRPQGNQSVLFRLFVPYAAGHRYRMPSPAEVVRVIYTPAFAIAGEPLPIDGSKVDGELIGIQRLPKPAASPTLDDYERRLAKKYG